MIKRLFISAIVALTFVSCAQEAPSLITDQMSDEFFRQWVKRNAPKAIELQDGVFIEYLHKANIDTASVKPNTSWLALDYTIRTIEGRIIATRDSSLSRLVGKWKKNTHFVDDYLTFANYDTYINICIGAQRGITDMKKGDRARIYVSAKYAYYSNTLNMNSGYLGESVTYMGSPIIFEARLDEIVNNPVRYERDSIEKWARANWNQTPKDTLSDGIYVKMIKVLPDGEKIEKDQTVTVDFTEYFTDGFIINTTVDSIAKKYGIYDESNKSQYTPLKFAAGPGSNTLTTVPRAINNIILKLRRGEHADILTMAEFTKSGTFGDLLNIPQILPYQPRIYRIHVYSQEEENDK